MAQKVILEKDGIIKNGFVGFSWTTFFFNCFVPLLRGDFLGALIIFLVSVFFGFLTEGIGNIILSIVLGFWYNKYYTKNLVEKIGYRPVDENGKYLLKQYDIFINDKNYN